MIWMPDWFYNRLPWWCLFWATLVWFIPTVWYGIASSVILYSYAGWLIYKRYIE